MFVDVFFISDLKIKVGDRHISAHKFVLAARSDSWSLTNLSSTEELDLSGKPLIDTPGTQMASRKLLYACTVSGV